jgi:hypothetical protein
MGQATHMKAILGPVPCDCEVKIEELTDHVDILGTWKYAELRFILRNELLWYMFIDTIHWTLLFPGEGFTKKRFKRSPATEMKDADRPRGRPPRRSFLAYDEDMRYTALESMLDGAVRITMSPSWRSST